MAENTRALVEGESLPQKNKAVRAETTSAPSGFCMTACAMCVLTKSQFGVWFFVLFFLF